MQCFYRPNKSGSIKERTQTSGEMGIGCQRNGHWLRPIICWVMACAANQGVVVCGRQVYRLGSEYIRQLANYTIHTSSGTYAPSTPPVKSTHASKNCRVADFPFLSRGTPTSNISYAALSAIVKPVLFTSNVTVFVRATRKSTQWSEVCDKRNTILSLYHKCSSTAVTITDEMWVTCNGNDIIIK